MKHYMPAGIMTALLICVATQTGQAATTTHCHLVDAREDCRQWPDDPDIARLTDAAHAYGAVRVCRPMLSNPMPADPETLPKFLCRYFVRSGTADEPLFRKGADFTAWLTNRMGADPGVTANDFPNAFGQNQTWCVQSPTAIREYTAGPPRNNCAQGTYISKCKKPDLTPVFTPPMGWCDAMDLPAPYPAPVTLETDTYDNRNFEVQECLEYETRRGSGGDDVQVCVRSGPVCKPPETTYNSPCIVEPCTTTCPDGQTQKPAPDCGCEEPPTQTCTAIHTAWTPEADTVCLGDDFTQTRTCALDPAGCTGASCGILEQTIEGTGDACETCCCPTPTPNAPAGTSTGAGCEKVQSGTCAAGQIKVDSATCDAPEECPVMACMTQGVTSTAHLVNGRCTQGWPVYDPKCVTNKINTCCCTATSGTPGLVASMAQFCVWHQGSGCATDAGVDFTPASSNDLCALPECAPTYGEWGRDASEVCKGDSFTQTRECSLVPDPCSGGVGCDASEMERASVGTKEGCGECEATYGGWGPDADASEVCEGESFTQTRECSLSPDPCSGGDVCDTDEMSRDVAGTKDDCREEGDVCCCHYGSAPVGGAGGKWARTCSWQGDAVACSERAEDDSACESIGVAEVCCCTVDGSGVMNVPGIGGGSESGESCSVIENHFCYIGTPGPMHKCEGSSPVGG